jgi:hypothetical protein
VELGEVPSQEGVKRIRPLGKKRNEIFYFGINEVSVTLLES